MNLDNKKACSNSKHKTPDSQIIYGVHEDVFLREKEILLYIESYLLI